MKSSGLPVGCWVLFALFMGAMVFVLFSRGVGRTSFEGTYLRYTEHEFGKEWDTLLIQPGSSNAYQITRKWKYERVLDGSKITPEYKVGHTSAVLLPKENLLVEEESGLRYRLKKETLHVGETVYQKLK